MRFIEVNGIKIQLEKKRMKNFNLRVKAPSGEVTLSYPYHVKKQDYEHFIYSKLSWIKKQQARLRNVVVPIPLEYKSGERISFLGDEKNLTVQVSAKRFVNVEDNEVCLSILKTDTKNEKGQLLHEFYRKELYQVLLPLVKKWEPIMEVSVNETRIRRMKTLWGSCNINARRIWLSLELAKHKIESIEYVVVHEMVHLLERLHSPRFYQLMDEFLPDWRKRRALLNQKVK